MERRPDVVALARVVRRLRVLVDPVLERVDHGHVRPELQELLPGAPCRAWANWLSV